ncbi:hypothetical protein [Curtobacterium flaccumfaciens]|uniref:hypothetical protein n=1 Tax=Curtobacterium flaccumfaciens TaxID=2035 RepID=UPI001BDF06DE|nr:hypothetical protein [Curtobacterium flaccumfaciens]MBT1606278.1 hypothetical protein [Curtobacterium flaccumfaciens pv. betae]MBT1656940.1 hypothetical protein [Curtobacterium flaccumfaciens pv. betae]MCS0472706.1 hypothetical protein [Curtobacterium flaccumfaciens pv. betae]MCS0475056.1 hypothetical protein [Curtobacterium flaccumfaciens pv. betae]MCS0479442.1 hypothetical protein [Curtobacterium flaccumfaciens pv. betae]
MSAADLSAVTDGFIRSGVPTELVDELMNGFFESKRRFYLGDHRPNAVEGARFAEAAFRILQWATQPGGKYTPVGKTLPKVDQLLLTLLNGSGDASVRKHIPRALQIIYTIRNDRDVAHLGADIDPNLMDATLIVGLMSWVLAEFMRVYHSVGPDEAQRTIDRLVTREVPAVQEVNGFPRVLRDLRAGEYCLVLLYRAGTEGASFSKLRSWVRPGMRANLRRTLHALVAEDKAHQEDDLFSILRPGERYVEERHLLHPA